MAIIYSYPKNTDILSTDVIVGSSIRVVNGKRKNITKNFEVGTIAEFYNETSSIAITGQNNFFFQKNIASGRKPGSISFINGGGSGTNFSSITTIRISKKATSGNLVIDYINTFVNQAIIIAQVDNLNNFGIYKFISITQSITEPNFYDIVIEAVNANGSIQEDKFYGFAIYPGFINQNITPIQNITETSQLINDGENGTSVYVEADELGNTAFSNDYNDLDNLPTIPTKTSDLVNDGDDGINPFITLADIPPVEGFVPYTGATQNVDLGEYQIKAGQVEFDTTPTGTSGVGVMRWNDSDGTLDLGLKGGNVTLQIGQEQVVRVVNKTGSNLLESKYQAVRVTGAQGQRLKVDLALATNDLLSAETIGLVTENIDNNQDGFVTTSGLIRGINTTGSLQGETWEDGDVLYLSPSIAGRITNIKPTAPNHLVVIGYVVYAHANNGKIFVKVNNGYELEELHNVTSTNYTTPVDVDSVLTYDVTNSLWKRLTLANLKTELTNIRRNEQSGNINYCGYAPSGSLESDAVWTITKITVAINGSVTTTTSNNVTWTSVPF